jgi:DNA-binding IclR family transcriptional regulator
VNTTKTPYVPHRKLLGNNVLTDPDELRRERGSLKSMQKLMSVLDCFSRSDRSLTLQEIAVRCEMPKTTVHRLVRSLKEAGLLEQDKGRDRYRLGMRLFELGSTVLANLDVQREAKVHVEQLGRVSRQHVNLCIFDGINTVIVDQREPDGSTVNWTTTLSLSPSYCTGVGKAMLAFQDAATIDKVIAAGLIRYTEQTITDPALLRRELAEVRQRGYALDNGEHQVGLQCVAAPIRNAAGRVFAAVSVNGPQSQLPAERLPMLGELVVNAASNISRDLGYIEDKRP